VRYERGLPAALGPDTLPVHLVACPDKFRGSLKATEAAAAMARAARRCGIDTVTELPLADGGEGTIDVVLAISRGERRRSVVTGPLGAPVDAAWAMLHDGTAVIEMAQASGIALVELRNDPIAATTRGTGELIALAIDAGARRVVVGAGGSATTDGGRGALEALDWTSRGVELVVLADVTTSFVDAANVFGPQKGATAIDVAVLRRRLQRLRRELETRTGIDVGRIPGGGAAGGLAGGLASIGATIESGFDHLAARANFEKRVAGADLVLTGEGRFDASSLRGKVVGNVLRRTPGARQGVIAGQATTPPPVGVGLAVLGSFAGNDDPMIHASRLVEEATMHLLMRVV
jgi:glycerate 2-kinase